MALIEVRDLGKIYQTGEVAVEALRDVSISEPSLETLFLHHTGRSLRD